MYDVGARSPSVFLSSTCYDLSQIRCDLKDFFEQLGFDPLLSEYGTFPIDPDKKTVENCLRVVQERADIFVLVVGGRYGHISDTGKSVTNLEYLQAKAKSIPVYVFVSKSIVDTLSVWRDNPNGNFESVVDSPKLFEFVDALRGAEGVWIHPFNAAKDIIETLRKQLSYLFLDSLLLRKKIQNQRLSAQILNLSPTALKIVLEQPDGWEYKLFGQLADEGMNNLNHIKMDLKYGVTFATKENLETVQENLDKLNRRINDLVEASKIPAKLINEGLIEACGKPGVAGNAEHIIYIAERLIAVYKHRMEWVLDLKSEKILDEWKPAYDKIIEMGTDFAEDIENYCRNFFRETQKLPAVLQSGQNYKLDCAYKLRAPDAEGFAKELEKLRKMYGIQS